MLFTNLDEVSNKGLIKGLIMLSHLQEKKLKQSELFISKMKTQIKSELMMKEKIIRDLNDELNGLKSNLKGCKLMYLYNSLF